MNDLMVKPVDVFGNQVMAAKDKNGNIYAGVNYFCNALGMTKGQRDKQVQKVQKDEVLKQGCFRLEAGVFDHSNESIALRIDFIPLWLTKIVITEKTRKEHPELANKLLQYQLKAKDILAEAFMPKYEPPQTTGEKIALLAQGHVELKAEIDGVKADLEQFKNDMPILGIEESKISNAVKKKGAECLGGKQSNAYNDKSLRGRLYSDIYRQLRREFGVSTYKAIKRNQTDSAIAFLKEYQPPLVMKEEIENTNAQLNMDIGGV